MNGIGRGSGDKQEKNKASIMTRETVGMTLLLFGAIIFLITATGPYLFGDVGRAIASFFVGVAGYFVYPLLVYCVYGAFVLVSGKRPVAKGWIVRSLLLLIAVFLIVHTATAERFFIDPETSSSAGYGSYLGGCFRAAGESLGEGTGGGVLFGLLVYPLRFLFRLAGVYVVFSLLLAGALWFLLIGTPLRRYLLPSADRGQRERRPKEEKGVAFEDLPERSAPPMPEREAVSSQEKGRSEPALRTGARGRMNVRQDDAYARSREILFSDDAASNYRENLIYNADSNFNSRPRRSTMERSEGGRPQTGTGESYSDGYTRQTEEPRSPMPRRVTEQRPSGESGYSYPVTEEYDANYPKAPSYRAPVPPVPERTDYYDHDVEEPLPEDGEPVRRAESCFDGQDGEPRDLGFDRPQEGRGGAIPLGGRERNAAIRDLFSRPAGENGFNENFGRGLRDIPEERDPENFGRGLRDIPEERDPDGFGRGLRDIPEERDPDGFGRGLRDIPEERDPDGFGRGLRDIPEEPAAGEEILPSRVPESGIGTVSNLFDDTDGPDEPLPPPPAPKREEKPKKKHVWKKYRRPDVSLLDDYPDKPEISRAETGKNSGIILDTLRRYGLETEVINVVGGAAVTRYDLAMPERATINMVTKYSGEIAMYLKVKNVNMYANPEVGGISVEVPNAKRVTVGLKTVIESDRFQRNDPEALTFALGQDLEGRSVCGDISDMTHILVAGTTGSGKSITMHAMLISLLYKYSPEQLRLILIDPKQSEFTIYEGLPHLMINEIITQPAKVVTALNWAIKEMERRYALFNEKTRSGMAVRKIDEYNATLAEGEEKLPKIVIVVDEFGDLMLVVKKDLEERIQRLTQKARAAGIHIVLATQRPSADVVTGVIKGNLPTRIALSVDSELNSRIILDETGAETLLGKGDMLVKSGGKTRRVQGVYIGPGETQRVVNYIRENNEAYYDDEISDFIDKSGSSGGETGGGDGDDVNETYIKALAIVIKRGQASISLIQRSCGVGYNHAGKIIEWMEGQGYISKFDGAKARAVLLTKEEFESKYGSLD